MKNDLILPSHLQPQNLNYITCLKQRHTSLSTKVPLSSLSTPPSYSIPNLYRSIPSRQDPPPHLITRAI
ncbi:Uncharacterized protein HZ326_20123 [Fusarium oxysporum f. sp. albedinis]|nr:Uncharacterized protein HZ326_20123 [Fusarium oxysporum f. sp. albedinis]